MREKYRKLTNEREAGKIRAGSFLVGKVHMSYTDLVKAFGEPTYDALNDLDNCETKVSTEFVFSKTEPVDRSSSSTETVTTVFTVYDWKATDLYLGRDGGPTVEEFRASMSKESEAAWHIGGHVGGEELEEFLNFLDRSIEKATKPAEEEGPFETLSRLPKRSPFPAHAKSADGPVDGPYPYHD